MGTGIEIGIGIGIGIGIEIEERKETIQEQPVYLLGTTKHAKSAKIMSGDILFKEQRYSKAGDERSVNQAPFACFACFVVPKNLYP